MGAFAACVSLIFGSFLMLSGGPASAAGVQLIEGSGSSWAAVAIDQWINDVTPEGLRVVYTPTGSQEGRQDFANGITDFGVTDLPYMGTDPVTGTSDVSTRPYGYLPIAAGGTAFPYNIAVDGQRVTNLRLSQSTLAKIFTDQITNWDDPEITADNNGRRLPSIPIVPVVHSEEAGTTYQLTDFLSSEFPSLWNSFSGLSSPTQEWPAGKGAQIPENGSDNVKNFIVSSAGQGSIGFDEYAYALQSAVPVAAVENSSGYFTTPTADNVALSLTQAQINNDPNPADCGELGFAISPCYLLEKLNGVWEYSDPRDYPLSSYSYMIIPTSAQDPIDTAKRQALADFVGRSLCQGQGETEPLGYAPLPYNLVDAGFQELATLAQADPNVQLDVSSLAECQNPTFLPDDPTANYLGVVAPMPPSCDKAGSGPCDGPQVGTSTSVSVGPDPAEGTPAELTAHVTESDAPTAAGQAGRVEFFDGTTLLATSHTATSAASNSGVDYSAAATFESTGTHDVTAVFTPSNPFYEASASSVDRVGVGPAVPTPPTAGSTLGVWSGAPGTAGSYVSAHLDVAPGTSPAVTTLTNGKEAIAYQASGGVLWTWVGTPGSTGTATSAHLGMKAGTSPSVIALNNGRAAVAFQANTGRLWTWHGVPGTAGSAGPTVYGMAAATSPSVTTFTNGRVAVAFQANTAKLWTWRGTPGTGGGAGPTSATIPSGTSPAVATLADGKIGTAL